MIDWKFIEELEGSGILNGYVPLDKDGLPIGKSGVTVATGVDLGQLDRTNLVRLLKDKSFNLIQKLLPYVGVTGESAVHALIRKPLTLTQDEAETLAEIVRERIKKDLVFYWEIYEGVGKFEALPAQAQTVLYSLAYNFGPNLPERLPNTWAAFIESAETGNWSYAVTCMLQFPSKNKELVPRRKKEALLLGELLPIKK